MGKKSKTPEAPNYSALAQQQGALNQQAWGQALSANRPTQVNAAGSQSWSQDPTTGAWTQTNTLNQPQQDIFNAQQANQATLAGKVGGMMGGLDTSQIDLSKAPGMPTVGGYNQQVIDTMNQLQAPQLERQRKAKEAQMAAMGLGLGSGQAYNAQQDVLNQSENDAGLKSILAGIQQGNTQFGQGMQLHQQGVQDILNQRAGNLGQLSGLMGLTQQQGPNAAFNPFQDAGTYQPANMMGAAQNQYNASLDKSNAANADKASNAQAVGTVVGIAAVAF